jgi:hypothetical protein
VGVARSLCLACVFGCGGPVPSPAGGAVGVTFDGRASSPWATFWNDGPVVTPDNWADFGPCHVLVDEGGAPNNPTLTAGTVTIAGGTQTITLMPGSNGFYDFGIWGI